VDFEKYYWIRSSDALQEIFDLKNLLNWDFLFINNSMLNYANEAEKLKVRALTRLLVTVIFKGRN
jgi:hypothetical protein